MAATATSKWLQPQRWPVIGVTVATVFSLGVYARRHTKNQPDLARAGVDRRDVAELSNPEGTPAQEEGYGRKSAKAAGLMEGDRAFQGIFPAKKMTEAMAPVLPAKQPDHPSQEKNVQAIKTSTPQSKSP